MLDQAWACSLQDLVSWRDQHHLPQRDERRHAKANLETTCPKDILLFPSSTIFYVPFQTASPLRSFTEMMPKVKTFMEFACNIRKMYICSTQCQNAIESWCCAYIFHHVPFHALVSLSNMFVIFEASFLCLTFFQSSLSIFFN